MEDRIMHGEPVGSDVCPRVDVTICCPDNGVVRIERARLFADPDGLLCGRFVGRVLLAPGIDKVMITPAIIEQIAPGIELRFDATLYSPRRVLEQVANAS